MSACTSLQRGHAVRQAVVGHGQEHPQWVSFLLEVEQLEVEQDKGQSTSAWFFVYIGHRRRVHHLTGGKPHLRWLPVPDDWARIGRVILSGA